MRLRDRTPLDRSMLVSMALGKTLLAFTKVMVHELKVNKDRELRKIGKEKEKIQIKLHKSYHEIFGNVETVLYKEEINLIENTINDLIDSMW